MHDNALPVKVSITFRSIESTEPLRTYATDKFTHVLQKFVHHPTEAHLVLKVEKNSQIAEISLHADGADFHASESSPDLYASIDALVDTLSQQLRKHKEKTTKHH